MPEPSSPKSPPTQSDNRRAAPTLRAILTDIHLWVPLTVLAAGIAILIYCAH